MGKSKKTVKKSQVKKTVDQVEARPIGEGKDPLAEGARLHNPTNTTGETHYEADDSELKDEEKAAKNRINGQDADTRAVQHNAESPTAPDNVPDPEQEEVAAGRTEEDVNPPVDDTPEDVEVPERTEEQEEKDSEDREEAIDKASKTTDKV